MEGRKWIIHSVTLKHLAWGLLALIWPATWDVTSMAMVYRFYSWRGLPAALILVSAGVWGVMWAQAQRQIAYSFWWWGEAALLVVQQYFLILAATGSILAVVNGAYLDGTPAARPHIFADQMVYFIWTVFHSIALWEMLGRPLWRKLFTSAL